MLCRKDSSLAYMWFFFILGHSVCGMGNFWIGASWIFMVINYSGGPSIPATLGTEIFGLIIEVATFQGLIYTRVCNWDKQHVAVIERWPQFRGLG